MEQRNAKKAVQSAIQGVDQKSLKDKAQIEFK